MVRGVTENTAGSDAPLTAEKEEFPPCNFSLPVTYHYIEFLSNVVVLNPNCLIDSKTTFNMSRLLLYLTFVYNEYIYRNLIVVQPQAQK